MLSESIFKFLFELISMTFFCYRLIEILIGQVSYEKTNELSKIFDWMKIYCENCPATTSVEIYKPATELYFKLTLRIKTYFNLFKDIALKIRAEVGNLDQSIQVRFRIFGILN